MSTDNADWLYHMTVRGDVVTYTGTDRTIEPGKSVCVVDSPYGKLGSAKLVGRIRRDQRFGHAALGVELEQLVGHVLHGLLYPCLGLDPLLGAELVEDRHGTGVGGSVFLN